MSRKPAGRIRCGRCRKVLADPDAQRQPRVAELRAIDQLEGASRLEKAKRRSALSRPTGYRFDREDNRLDQPSIDAGPTMIYCDKCAVRYLYPADIRRWDAADRGEDLYLGHTDAARNKR